MLTGSALEEVCNKWRNAHCPVWRMMSSDTQVCPTSQGHIALPTSRILTAPEDISSFAEGHNQAAGRRLYDAVDFSQMMVRGFYLGGTMVAGYAINVSAPYFYLDLIPPDVRTRLPLLNHHRPLRFAEMRALWIQRRVPNYLRAQIYCRTILDCAAQRPDYLLGGTVIPAARRMQMWVVPRPLWDGAVEAWGEQHHAWLFYGTPAECVLRLPYAITRGWLERISARR